MDIKELKERIRKLELNEIKTTLHSFQRMQDKRRKINLPQIIKLIISQEGLYKMQEEKAINPNELKFKLWFKLNYMYDMNIYIVINEKEQEKGLNSLKIISAHKVKKNVQERIEQK